MFKAKLLERVGQKASGRTPPPDVMAED